MPRPVSGDHWLVIVETSNQILRRPGVTVNPIGTGTWSMGGPRGRPDHAFRAGALQSAGEKGANFFVSQNQIAP